MAYTFILPLSVTLPRKTKADKKIMLNMNIYRNLHHSVNNQVKQLFTPIEEDEDFIDESTWDPKPITVSYHVEKRTKRKYDIMNIASIVDKCFLDWMVKECLIPDDNLLHVQYGAITGDYDCEHDRVIATIEINS